MDNVRVEATQKDKVYERSLSLSFYQILDSPIVTEQFSVYRSEERL